MYDPEWRAFVRWEQGLDPEDPEKWLQVVTYAESAETVPGWAASIGLDYDTRERLRANPTPGCYQGTEPPEDLYFGTVAEVDRA